MSDRTELDALIAAIIHEEAAILRHQAALVISRSRLATLRHRRTQLGTGGQGTMDGPTRSRLSMLRRDRGKE